jgi:uncharacterized PurR-regulated membrane protein YhhQ (DUF165 family)
MTPREPSARQDPTALIDRDKRMDRFIRRVATAAWSVTFLIALLLTVMTGIQVAQFVPGASAGEVPWMVVIGLSMPLIIVLGFLAVLIATLSTVGIFLRLRTSSLSEIQMRLAALEEMLADERRGQ